MTGMARQNAAAAALRRRPRPMPGIGLPLTSRRGIACLYDKGSMHFPYGPGHDVGRVAPIAGLRATHYQAHRPQCTIRALVARRKDAMGSIAGVEAQQTG